MSLIPTGVTILEAGVQGLLNPVFFQARSIGGFIADVTVEERHNDDLRITDHPVERNAVISDHAFKLPMRVAIRVGYSNSSPQSEGDSTYINAVYAAFLAMQESVQLIDILTGKRFYQNMLIERLSVTTDEKTENALFMLCECREIIIVDTVVTQTASAQNQTSPDVTQPVVNQGSVAASPATNVNYNAGDATFAAADTNTFSSGSVNNGSVGSQSFDATKTSSIPIATAPAKPISGFASGLGFN